MAIARAAVQQAPKGHQKPRIAPPVPARSDLAGYRAVAKTIGITPMPWQDVAARYLEGLGTGRRYLYREVAIEVARQNGKTTLLRPLIRKRLRAGRRIMHTAQNRELPREVFGQVADDLGEHDPDLFVRRRGRLVMPRYANGQEEISLSNGGRYRIVAPTRGGARGGTNDDVIIDELREMESFDFIGAAKPTMTTSRNPQIVYLSNAGEVDSVVLKSVRDRAGKDPRLALLEWSAAPELAANDLLGWLQANPAIGHSPTMLGYLEDEYLSNKLAGTLAIFETEHLCREQPTTREALVDITTWGSRQSQELGAMSRPFLGISVDPAGARASAAIAWQRADESIGLRVLFDVTGSPIDIGRLGKDMRERARAESVGMIGFDPLTDAALAKHFPRTTPITGRVFANASSTFVTAVEGGRLHWTDAGAVTGDLSWTTRKAHDESGSFEAVRGNDERPITAALASIRAVWLASAPQPKPVPRRSAMGF